MTSSWRHFRFCLLVSLPTYPPSFITIGCSLICVPENRIFDDVIMTSYQYRELYYIATTQQTYCWKNYESTVFRSPEINKRSKNRVIHIKSRDDVITTWLQFLSITRPDILVYQVSIESDSYFWRYGALKFAFLWWRHSARDDVTILKMT